jgi:hypothetical protein
MENILRLTVSLHLNCSKQGQEVKAEKFLEKLFAA